MHKTGRKNCYISSLKGTALLIAIDTKLVRKDIFGRSDIGPFLQFWEIFSPMLENAANNSQDFSDVLEGNSYQTADDK